MSSFNKLTLLSAYSSPGVELALGVWTEIRLIFLYFMISQADAAPRQVRSQLHSREVRAMRETPVSVC